MSKGTSNFDGATVSVDRSDELGNVILCKCATGSIPSAAAGYAVGCILIDTTTGDHYKNVGTTSSCSFIKDSLGSTNGTGYFVATKTLNGSTPVNIFGATNGFDATITGVYIITSGTTSSTITIAGTAGTVATITGGASTSTMVGATSVANTSLDADGTLTAVSNKGGAASPDTSIIFITFTVT